MKSLYDVLAPAKLNLFLHVIGRRADGMHLLQSAFMLIDWCDTLHFEPCAGNGISRADLSASLPTLDLIIRAAQALQQATGHQEGVHISVDKQVPAQAGMGGGSSDAASTLLALNRLWNLKLPLAVLSRIGLRLGADVPFFLAGQNAWIEGVGEVVTPISLASARFVVIKPPAGLDTARIFSNPALKRDTDAATMSGFAADPFGFGRNDLQAVASAECPGVHAGLQWLAAQGLRGRMTGSGSAVFARLQHDLDVARVDAGFEARLCRNLERHPLWGWAPE